MFIQKRFVPLSKLNIMEKFREKKIVNVLELIAISLFILGLICTILLFVHYIFLIGVIFFTIGALLVIVSSFISNKGKYSEKFIDYMNDKVSNSNNLFELKECLNEFEELAIKDGMYDLKYPYDLRRIHEKILYQIEILEKQKN